MRPSLSCSLAAVLSLCAIAAAGATEQRHRFAAAGQVAQPAPLLQALAQGAGGRVAKRSGNDFYVRYEEGIFQCQEK